MERVYFPTFLSFVLFYGILLLGRLSNNLRPYLYKTAISVIRIKNLKTLWEVIFAASIAWYKNDQNIKPSLFVAIFAYQPHWEKLLSSKRSSKAIKCIDGIRALSIMWVVLGHCWTQLTNGATNTSTARKVKIFSHNVHAFDTLALLILTFKAII